MLAMHTHTHAHTHTHIHTHMHAYTHTHIHTRSHTHTYVHTYNAQIRQDSSVTAPDSFQTGVMSVTSIRRRKWFTETGQTITETGQTHSRPYYY